MRRWWRVAHRLEPHMVSHGSFHPHRAVRELRHGQGFVHRVRSGGAAPLLHAEPRLQAGRRHVGVVVARGHGAHLGGRQRAAPQVHLRGGGGVGERMRKQPFKRRLRTKP
jgi:hypothetical protein